ncbi:ribonuclease H-like domain-containing protein [Patescibacteria group bacterium]|nr:ribonuclease H-like domain-containing protein [Patescibacteria group bacterium]MBU1721832.1 ribonuclease H-like domain-containing protein [Patescibacteria group bacterium]MBU1901673.1 ribonuclease H-like domain-containing protein [Patescibacteria group bacterium]
MSREIVFDIETIGDIKNLSTMKVTVVSIYEYETDSYRSFEEHELKELWPILEKAERIIGYNSEHFDVPILNRYYTGDLTIIPHLDLLKVIKESCGKRFKLDDVAQATLQMKKSADGLIAMEWFRQGEIQKVKDYCEQDVRVTKEVYDYGVKNSMIYYPTITGEVMPIAVNFAPAPVPQGQGGIAGAQGFNLTLPL